MTDLLQRIQRYVSGLSSVPTIPHLLVPLLQHLCEPAEDVRLGKVVQLISQDPSLSGQCLRMANSPLFGVRGRIDSIRGAVITLGLSRVRQLATTCCLLQSFRGVTCRDHALHIWSHSLAIAMVSEKFARQIKIGTPEIAYSAGLLHDLGVIIELAACPSEFDAAAHLAAECNRDLHDCELELYGFDHTIAGDLIAQEWNLPQPIKDVIRYHHDVEHAPADHCIVAVVNVCDLLCRMRNLGYGFDELTRVDISAEPGWNALSSEFKKLQDLDLERFTLELDSYIDEVRELISELFQPA